jgi:transcriptional regulator of acetoin/glycerol metabolism
MSNPWLAWPAGTDPRALSRSLRIAHEEFLASGLAPSGVRTLVADSWRRSVTSGVDTERTLAPVDLLDDELEAYRSGHPLALAMPLIRRLLVEDATDAGLIVAVTDASGRLLWVEGDPALRTQAAGMHFMEGASWDEASAGTSAPGIALALDHPVQVFAGEHFSRAVQPWSCSAAPIHHPQSGELLGVIDVTGGDVVATPNTLTLVRTAASAVESELRLMLWQAQQSPVERRQPKRARTREGARLRVLGQPNALVRHAGHEARLSLRHSELALLIALSPAGMTAEELAVALHEDDGSAVTVRVEMSRLRPLLADLGLSSRPYRLSAPLLTDVHLVQQHLVAGEVRQALDAYEGAVLPRSTAPGVVAAREDLRAHLREVLLRQPSVEPLLRYGRTPDGLSDHQIWQAALDRLGPHETARAEVAARLDRLEREFGA